MHRAVFQHVDLHAGLFDDRANLLPPGPIRSRILSVGMLNLYKRGANAEMFGRPELSVPSIMSRMWKRAFFACAKASRIIGIVMLVTLMSICRAVMPSRVPATLKSISP